jgi:hypothetical protein
VQAYFESGGQSLAREMAALRDQASIHLDFENAAAQHARLEKLKPVLSQLPEMVRRIDGLAGIMVQRGAAAEAVNFFRIERGCISGPMAFAIQSFSMPSNAMPSKEHIKSRSMESRVQEALAALPAADTKSALENMEHLALLKRWYYRGTRGGEIFFTDEKGQLPLRRLVRGISRVYRGEKAEEIAVTT